MAPSAWVAVVAGANVLGLIGVVAIWWLGRHDLLDGPPYWVFMLLILASIGADAAGRWWHHHSASRVAEHARVVIAVGSTTAILYMSGWGSVLGIAYALAAVQLVAQLHGIDSRRVFAWCVLGIVAGEAAVQTGLAPSMVALGAAHMLAGVGIALLGGVLWIVNGVLAARDSVEQEVRHREQLLVREVATDSLTQLLNRAAFTAALERSCSAGEPAILAFVDLDNFKDINDSFGHHVGDQVLAEVARRLKTVVRNEDVIARFGGDEFVILVRSSSDENDADRLVERIWAVLGEPWPTIAPNTISASVGVVDDRDGTRSPEDLLQEADEAMYARKHGMSAAGSMATMTSRALTHHRLAMDGMGGSFAVLRAIREGTEIVDFEIVEANSPVRAAAAPGVRQIVGTRVSQFYVTDDRADLLPLYKQVLRTGKPFHSELHHVMRNGRNVRLSVNIITVDRDLVAVITHDVTAKAEAREALEQERGRFARLIARSSDLACVIDASGAIVYAPPPGVAFLGYSDTELHSPLSKVAPVDRDAAAAWLDAIRNLPPGGEGRPVALRFIASDGSVHTCDVSADNRADEPAIGGIVLNVHDVSAVVAAEARLAAVADAVSDVIAICDSEGAMMWVSGAVRDALGLEPDDLVGVSAFEVIHPDDRNKIARRLEFMVANASFSSVPVDIRLRHANGTYRWFEASGSNQLDDPSIRGLVISLRDTTDRRAHEQALRISEARNRSIVEAAADAILSVDTEGIIRSFNPAAEHIFGVTGATAVGEHYRRFLPEDSVEIVRNTIRLGTIGHQLDLVATRASGERFSAQVAISKAQVGSAHYYTAVVRDISEQRALEEALRIAATRDDLTGLANRRTLLDHAQAAIDDARRTDDVVGMVFVDLDRFKLVNDGLGHDAGDQLLLQVADRIAGVIREQDVVARLASDEFVVLCPSASDLDAIKTVASRIVETLTGAFLVAGNEVFVGASIGVSVSTGSETPLELLRYADTAMYRSKEVGSSRVEVFDSRMQRNAARRLDVESALRQAVARDELCAYYQPIVGLEGGEVANLEALMRWDRRGVGLIRPDNFIPVAEEAGIILEIGAWMLERATTDCARWQSLAPGVGVSVNVSVRQFESGDLVAEVQAALAASGLDPALLTIEITESVMLAHSDRNAAIMRRIRDLGMHISLDDFGSGYSSLTYLRLLPIDSIKIDRSFLQSLGTAARDRSMLRAIVNLGAAHDLAVVAEGIDTDAKLAAVRAVGCTYGQGFLFSKPMPLAETLAFLEAGAPAIPTARA